MLCCCAMRGGFWAAQAASGAPPAALLALYALLAFAQTLPLTAVAQVLQDQLRVPLAAQSTFWATGFLPWALKVRPREGQQAARGDGCAQWDCSTAAAPPQGCPLQA